MAANVKVIVDPKNMKIIYEVNGVQGESCEEITRLLTMDREVEDEGFTEEYHYREGLPNYRSEGN